MKIKKAKSREVLEMFEQFIGAEKKEIDKFISGLTTEQKDILLIEILSDRKSGSEEDIMKYLLDKETGNLYYRLDDEDDNQLKKMKKVIN
jgi:F0F1-type ATP synthase delta subunit